MEARWLDLLEQGDEIARSGLFQGAFGWRYNYVATYAGLKYDCGDGRGSLRDGFIRQLGPRTRSILFQFLPPHLLILKVLLGIFKNWVTTDVWSVFEMCSKSMLWMMPTDTPSTVAWLHQTLYHDTSTELTALFEAWEYISCMSAARLDRACGAVRCVNGCRRTARRECCCDEMTNLGPTQSLTFEWYDCIPHINPNFCEPCHFCAKLFNPGLPGQNFPEDENFLEMALEVNTPAAEVQTPILWLGFQGWCTVVFT